jgi:hypothetical protein
MAPLEMQGGFSFTAPKKEKYIFFNDLSVNRKKIKKGKPTK